MKTILFTFSLFLIFSIGSAQIPQGISYQAMIRNSTNQVVTNQGIGIRISIVKGLIDSTIIYQEIYNPNPKTNTNGIVSFSIGTGIPLIGIFDDIEWSDGNLFIKTEIDPLGGTEYSIISTTQLLAVPYAMYSQKTNEYEERDPIWTSVSENYYTKEDTQDSGKAQINFHNIYNRPNTIESYGINNVVTIDSEQTINGNKNFTGSITIPAPSNDDDAATKKYVDDTKLELQNMFQSALVDAGLLMADAEGNIYPVIKIGEQTWASKNLKSTKFRNGNPIPHITDSNEWAQLTTPAYCWYDNNPTNGEIHGALYNWYAVNTGDLCPLGWRVSTWEDVGILSDYLGGNETAGGKLKQDGTTLWESPNLGATNSSGFTALPSGGRLMNGEFLDINKVSTFWTSFSFGADIAIAYFLTWETNQFFNNAEGNKKGGLSVRCIKE
jgi:uncharacterized protein (TIGR02145 family)